ncbi:MAG: 2-C-methyl-D-erythritol 4-phosphate cytidylyltransferase [Chthoniobacterales bacterium]
MLTAIIVAGGSGRRMGFDKTFASLGGKPVIAHALCAFEAAGCVDDIILVGRVDRLEDFRGLVTSQGFAKVRSVIAGGAERQDSVASGLAALSSECDYVVVHDAARPLVRPEEIESVFNAARMHGAAALAGPVADTLKRADGDRMVVASLEREGLFAMQTPQIFSRRLLEEAYAKVRADGLSITDEVSAVQNLGRKVVLVPNDAPNFKITFPMDLALAELILQSR